MKVRGKWFPVLLSATVFPGAGQWYVGRRLRGGLMIGMTLLLTLAGIARFLSVVFALANKQGVRRPPELNPLPLLIQAWKIDHLVLSALLLSILALWILSILDLTLSPKGGNVS